MGFGIKKMFCLLLDMEATEAEMEYKMAKFDPDYEKIKYKTKFWQEYERMLRNVKTAYLLKDANKTSQKK